MSSDFIVAIHAMTFLYHKGETVPSDVLADNACTNPARVRRVMAKLKNAGLVHAKEGRKKGGYSYPLERVVTLGDIARALSVTFSGFNWHSGDKERECLISSGMGDYTENLSQELDRKCLEYLDTVTVSQVEEQLIRRQ
ncbi:MAG: Rrf2 family transcriptional regulator [Bacillota bacterium]|nr:Rrf2 family transcriptional regulator [Bacillota bacterium]